ncbi:MAG: phosphatidate cytidylyltransferase [Thermoanaerobaculia bacterium]|nr:phosphatidate cytidylyltransferase [Thermoanaerobaculia bacterium]
MTAPPSPSDSTQEAEPPSGVGQRLITGFGVGGFALVAIFTFPPLAAFVTWLVVFVLAASEYAAIVRHWAPSAPLRSLLIWVPVAATGGAFVLLQEPSERVALATALGLGFGLVAIAALTTLFGKCDVREAAVSMGFLAFGIPYFAIPPIAMYRIHMVDAWLVFLLVAIVAFGDSAAYFVGRKIGRHKIAPRVSPKKSWEGSVAGFLAGILTMALWAYFRLGEVHNELLALAAVTAVTGQLGDLVESLVKRGAGVKDSSNILPGHGGFYDRLDALILATPVFVLGLWFLGFEAYVPK